jgi:hypothetical protein
MHVLQVLTREGIAVAATNAMLALFHSVGYNLMERYPTSAIDPILGQAEYYVGYYVGKLVKLRFAIAVQAQPSRLEAPYMREMVPSHYFAHEAIELHDNRNTNPVPQQIAGGSDAYLALLPSDVISHILLFCSVRGSYQFSLYRPPQVLTGTFRCRCSVRHMHRVEQACRITPITVV